MKTANENKGDLTELENELGDILFSIVNYSRFLNINPENALRKTITKFIDRFQFIEKRLAGKGKKITESNLQEMDTIWDESKTIFP